MAEAKPTWVGAMLNGRYRIESVLGRGGMSSVYKAMDTRLKRTVAVKMIHPHLSERPQFVSRFEQEASAVASLRHPNILQVHDYDHDKDTYYMVLEYIPGQTLDQRLESLKTANLRLPLAEVIHLMVPLCEAVAYAHGQGIYHRDLKPSNIIINLLGQAILMDFGVAKIVGGQVHTDTGATIGTASYMAPESVKGEKVDHRADLYSLGVILYEMAAGNPPFEGSSPLTVMLAHVNEPIPDIRLSNSNIPDVLVSILHRALAKDPANRFQSAVEMANALRTVGQQLAGTTGSGAQLASSPSMVSGEFMDTMPVGGRPLTDTGSRGVAATEVHQRAEPTPPPLPAKTETARSGGRFMWMAGGAVVILLLLAVVAAAVIFLPGLLASPPSSEDMVQIPSGTYTVGLGEGGPNYAPVQETALDEYWIDRYEVTGAQFADYLRETGNNAPATWPGGSLPTGQAEHPVQGVTWDMANSYCDWANKRLPTEAEWEVAARGNGGLLYPWGDVESAVSLPQGQSYTVGSVPANQSTFGVFDMAGNVWEWVDEPYTDIDDEQQVLRGGAHDFLKDMAYRLIGDPEVPTMYTTAGFRCAADEVELTADESLLVDEDFLNPESGWPEVDEGDVLSGYHPPDYYHVQSGEPNHISTAYFGGSFGNVSVKSDVFVDSTDTETGNFRYGLVVRRIGNQFYAFTVSPRSQLWEVIKGTEEGPVTIAEGEIETLQGLSSTDALRVDASGASLSFSINGQVVSQLSDSDYGIGDVGFYVETFDEERAHIHYDSLTVRQLPVATAENVILQDNFADPASGWPEVSEGSLLSGYHPPDYYHVQSGEPNHVSTAYFGQEFADFSMEANVFVDSTNTETGDFYYGLSVRHRGPNFYAFMISPRANHWKALKVSDNGPEILAEGDVDTLTAENVNDVLRVDVAGSDFLFSINGRVVTHLEDNDFPMGELGFIVETIDETRAHIHFDSLVVTEVDMDITAAPTAVVVVEPGAVTPTPEAVETVVVTPEPTPTPAGPLPSSDGMVKVAAGFYAIGNAGQTVELNEFWIDRFEVTNAQYAEYIQQVGAAPPDYWEGGSVPADLGNHPVESITLQDAMDYCNWLDKRLPTEAEWEAAARGPEGWLYPWGNVRTAVELPTSGTYPVGSIAENRSFFGVFDMAGNVWEWVDPPYEEVPAGEGVIKGGANNFQNDLVFRAIGDPESSNMDANAGIRCAASQVELVPDSLVLLNDDFADLNSGWFQARTPVGPYFYGYHPTDFYHVQVSEAEGCLTVFEEENFDNFMAEIDIFIAATNTEVGRFRYGLIFRDNGSEFYAFTISPRDQTWQVLKGTAEGMALMDSGTGSSIQGGTQATRDRLFVIANGPEMSFFLNGGLVSRVTDNTLTSGHVGFIVQTQDETYAHTHYDDITVWQLPPNLAPAEAVEEAQEYRIDSQFCQGSVSEENLLVRFVSYTIQEGDTLSGISNQFGISIEDILGANGRTIESPSFIRAGASIIIPMQT